jgi:P4 family phage/plasmid primase-like protien
MKKIHTTPPAKPWSEMTIYEQVTYNAVNMKWKMFPVYGIVDGKCACGAPHDNDSEKAGKHPSIASWQTEATSDLDTLSSWFKGRNDLNYGIFMEGSGLLALDIDVKSGGWPSWEQLEDKCMYDFLPTIEVRTGVKHYKNVSNRGAHKYYIAPESFRFTSNLSKVGFPGIDIKHNGYVLGPGSTHWSGVKYEWLDGHAPWEVSAQSLPEHSLGYMGRVSTSKRTYSGKSSIGDEEWQEKWETLMRANPEATAYAKATLRNICGALSKMKPGTGRNNVLNAAAYSMGRLIGGGQIGFEAAKNELRSAIQKAYGAEFVVKEAAVDSTLRVWSGGFECGAMEPKYPSSLSLANLDWISEKSKAISVPGTKPVDVVELAQQGFFNKDGLQRESLKIAIRAFGPLAVGPAKTLWSYSDGYWKQDGQDQVILRAGKENIVHFIKVEEPEIKDLGPLDYLNLKNGMLNWRTGEITPHDPKYFSAVQIPYAWNPDAKCPTVGAFIEKAIHSDLIDLIWEIIGICIYTGIGFQIAILLYGEGRNGKGTILRLIEKLIPAEFVAHVELQNLQKDKFAKAQLFGKILSIVGDMSSKTLYDPTVFKQITGQDTISAEFKYGNAFSFTSQATLLFAANKLPVPDDTSRGFFERILIVPFDKMSLEKHEVDDSIEPRMHLELEGVLVKAVEGLRRAKERGSFMYVQRCQDALERYKWDSLNLLPWWTSKIEFTGISNDRVTRTSLYDSYSKWVLENDGTPANRTVFYKMLQSSLDNRSEPVKIDGENYFNNIKLVD